MFQQMDYVYEIYKMGSFSKAAMSLCMTQPALSIAVKKLEEEIGQKLFVRNTTPIQLTEAGRAYVEKVEQIYQLRDELTEYYGELSSLLKGEIIVGAANISMNYILANVLPGFCENYPGISISVKEESLISLKQMLLEGTIDYVIDTDVFEDSMFDKYTLFTNHILVAVSDKWDLKEEIVQSSMSAQDILNEKHLAKNVRKVSLHEFEQIPFLGLMPENELSIRFRQICEYYDFLPKVKMSFNQQFTSFQFAKNGMGAVIVGDTIVKKAPDTGNMRYFVLDCPQIERHIVIASKKKRYLSKAAVKFREYMLEEFEKLKQD